MLWSKRSFRWAILRLSPYHPIVNYNNADIFHSGWIGCPIKIIRFERPFATGSEYTNVILNTILTGLGIWATWYIGWGSLLFIAHCANTPSGRGGPPLCTKACGGIAIILGCSTFGRTNIGGAMKACCGGLWAETIVGLCIGCEITGCGWVDVTTVGVVFCCSLEIWNIMID